MYEPALVIIWARISIENIDYVSNILGIFGFLVYHLLLKNSLFELVTEFDCNHRGQKYKPAICVDPLILYSKATFESNDFSVGLHNLPHTFSELLLDILADTVR